MGPKSAYHFAYSAQCGPRNHWRRSLPANVYQLFEFPLKSNKIRLIKLQKLDFSRFYEAMIYDEVDNLPYLDWSFPSETTLRICLVRPRLSVGINGFDLGL